MTTGAGVAGEPQRGHPPLRALVIVATVAICVGLGIGLAVHALRGHSGGAPAKLSGMQVAAGNGERIVRMRHGLYGVATWAVGAHPAPQINTLVDQHGQRFALSSLHGRTVALVFFDSHCRQACPLEGHALARAELALPAAQRPVLVAVSVNPADTRRSVATAIREWGLAKAAPWYWLMGKKARLAPVWRAYHIQVTPPIDGDIQHTEALYLIDRKGDIRSAYLWPFADHFVTSDLRTLAKRSVKA
jgi:cytochrome oxidase Cu insertion factor (SCO1/SenC/PrrC family)